MCTHVELVAVMMNESNPLLINDKQLTTDAMIKREGGRGGGKGREGKRGERKRRLYTVHKNINILEDSNVLKSGRRKQGS